MRYLFIFITLFVFFSCEKEEEQPCADNQICTDVFITVSIEVTDQNGDPVMLDNYYTFIDQRNRFDFTDSNYGFGEGVYVVATDNEMDEIDFGGTNVVFVGELGGVNVVEQPMILSKDCCHIELVQGETTIQIEL